MLQIAVLLLDIRNDRRNRLEQALKSVDWLRVDSKPKIDRSTYEASNFDIAVVHYGNREGPLIEDGWESKDTKVIIFSGGFTQPVAESEGTVYARASYLEEGDNLTTLLERVAGR